MRLKHYQTETLGVLTQFFKDARLQCDPAVAFNAIIQEPEQAKRLKGFGKPYKSIKGLENVPYACLRLPTGGGKTLLAAHTIIRDVLGATEPFRVRLGTGLGSKQRLQISGN